MKAIEIYKGDDSAAFNIRKITIRLATPMTIAGATAEFSLLDYAKTFTNAEVIANEMTVSFSRAQISTWPNGFVFGTFKLIDNTEEEDPQILCATTKIPFLVKTPDKSQMSSLDTVLVNTEYASVEIGWAVNYETAISDKPKINGVELVGDKTTEDLGVGDVKHSEFSGLPTDDLDPEETGIRQLCGLVNQMKNLLRPATALVALMVSLLWPTFGLNASTVQSAKLADLVGRNSVVTGVEFSVDVSTNDIKGIINAEVGGTNTLVHTNNITNFIDQTKTNGWDSVWATNFAYVVTNRFHSSVDPSITNGLAREAWTTNLVALATNGLARETLVTNLVTTATNGLASTNWVVGLDYATKDVTNGLATVTYVSNAVAHVNSITDGTNTIYSDGSMVRSGAYYGSGAGTWKVIGTYNLDMPWQAKYKCWKAVDAWNTVNVDDSNKLSVSLRGGLTINPDKIENASFAKEYDVIVGDGEDEYNEKLVYIPDIIVATNEIASESWVRDHAVLLGDSGYVTNRVKSSIVKAESITVGDLQITNSISVESSVDFVMSTVKVDRALMVQDERGDYNPVVYSITQNGQVEKQYGNVTIPYVPESESNPGYADNAVHALEAKGLREYENEKTRSHTLYFGGLDWYSGYKTGDVIVTYEKILTERNISDTVTKGYVDALGVSANSLSNLTDAISNNLPSIITKEVTFTQDITFQNGVQITDEEGHNVLQSRARKNNLGDTNDIMSIKGDYITLAPDRYVKLDTTNVIVVASADAVSFAGTNLSSLISSATPGDYYNVSNRAYSAYDTLASKESVWDAKQDAIADYTTTNAACQLITNNVASWAMAGQEKPITDLSSRTTFLQVTNIVDGTVTNYLPLSGGYITGSLNISDTDYKDGDYITLSYSGDPDTDGLFINGVDGEYLYGQGYIRDSNWIEFGGNAATVFLPSPQEGGDIGIYFPQKSGTVALLDDVSGGDFTTNNIVLVGSISNIVNQVADNSITSAIDSHLREMLGDDWKTTYGTGLGGILAAIFAAIAVLKKRIGDRCTVSYVSDGVYRISSDTADTSTQEYGEES